MLWKWEIKVIALTTKQIKYPAYIQTNISIVNVKLSIYLHFILLPDFYTLLIFHSFWQTEGKAASVNSSLPRGFLSNSNLELATVSDSQPVTALTLFSRGLRLEEVHVKIPHQKSCRAREGCARPFAMGMCAQPLCPMWIHPAHGALGPETQAVLLLCPPPNLSMFLGSLV